MARIVHFHFFFYFNLCIDNFDILFSYSNKQDRLSIFASHVGCYEGDALNSHLLIFPKDSEECKS